jgi:hypothetical protein
MAMPDAPETPPARAQSRRAKLAPLGGPPSTDLGH